MEIQKAPSTETKVVELIQITPSSGSAELATELTLPLTHYDISWLKCEPTETISFYHLTESTPHFYQLILAKLKHSLALTLFHYTPLAGRIIWPAHEPKPIIHYTQNHTVPLTIAESDADFDHVSSKNEASDPTGLRQLLPGLSISDSEASILAVQITWFPNSGFSIAQATHHGVVDGKTADMFLKSWAYLCSQNQSSLPKELIPCFDRTVINDKDGADMFILNCWTSNSPRSLKLFPTPAINSKLVRSTFVLSGEDIKKLKSWVSNGIAEISGETNEIRVSSYVVLYAYTLVSILKSRDVEKVKRVFIIFPVDHRGRLDSIPLNYFGNCVGGYGTIIEAKDLRSENGVFICGRKFNEFIAKMKKGEFEGALEGFQKIMKLEDGTVVQGIAGSPNFDYSRLDFGYGKPKKFEHVPTGYNSGWITMEKSREEDDGVEIGIVLEKQEMDIFGQIFVNGIKQL